MPATLRPPQHASCFPHTCPQFPTQGEAPVPVPKHTSNISAQVDLAVAVDAETGPGRVVTSGGKAHLEPHPARSDARAQHPRGGGDFGEAGLPNSRNQR